MQYEVLLPGIPQELLKVSCKALLGAQRRMVKSGSQPAAQKLKTRQIVRESDRNFDVLLGRGCDELAQSKGVQDTEATA